MSSLNMAELGQRVMKTRGKMWLSVAALESGDIEAEVLIEMDPSCYFVSNKKAKH